MTPDIHAQRQARIIGRAGMCSDDGRAITYYWVIYTNSHCGRGNWTQANKIADNEAEARDWCFQMGFEIVKVDWT